MLKPLILLSGTTYGSVSADSASAQNLLNGSNAYTRSLQSTFKVMAEFKIPSLSPMAHAKAALYPHFYTLLQ